jgi:hypothetical protein
MRYVFAQYVVMKTVSIICLRGMERELDGFSFVRVVMRYSTSGSITQNKSGGQCYKKIVYVFFSF